MWRGHPLSNVGGWVGSPFFGLSRLGGSSDVVGVLTTPAFPAWLELMGRFYSSDGGPFSFDLSTGLS